MNVVFRIVKVKYEMRLNLHLLSATINNGTEFKAKAHFMLLALSSLLFRALKNYHVDLQKPEDRNREEGKKKTQNDSLYICAVMSLAE